jgi:hypothetical protein
MDRSQTGIIIQDIKEQVCASSVFVSFIHVNRWCNEVAHVLAKSTNQIYETIWHHVAPKLLQRRHDPRQFTPPPLGVFKEIGLHIIGGRT